MDATHTGLSDETSRDVTIEYGTTLDNIAFCDRMFDKDGAETTDPVAAIEVEQYGELINVEPGGFFRVLVRVDGNGI